MRRSSRLSLLLIALTLATAIRDAHAWGPTGHRVVGEIAYSRLTPAARQGVARILGREMLARVSTWPDEIRSDETYRYTQPWHYIDIPDGETLATVKRAPEGDALSALFQMEATLRSRTATRDEKRFALAFLVHLVGDLHQPLHVGNGRDRGGTWCLVRWFGAPMHLHAVWDDGLIERQQLSYTEYARFLLQTLGPAQEKSWMAGTYEDWIAESQALRATVYPAKAAPYCAATRDQRIEDEARPSLGYEYLDRHRALVDQRLTQAGLRLALVLNRIFR